MTICSPPDDASPHPLAFHALSADGPLAHAPTEAIALVAAYRAREVIDTDGLENGQAYLCTGLVAFAIYEPCPMCAMALVHSRVRRLFFLHPLPTGACAGCPRSRPGLHVPALPGLNHRMEVWQWVSGSEQACPVLAALPPSFHA